MYLRPFCFLNTNEIEKGGNKALIPKKEWGDTLRHVENLVFQFITPALVCGEFKERREGNSKG